MSLNGRLEKIEASFGSSRRCPVCGTSPLDEVRFVFGGMAERHAPVSPSLCSGCGRLLVFSLDISAGGGDDAA